MYYVFTPPDCYNVSYTKFGIFQDAIFLDHLGHKPWGNSLNSFKPVVIYM